MLDEILTDMQSHSGPRRAIDAHLKFIDPFEFGQSDFQRERVLMTYLATGKDKGASEADLSSTIDKVRVFGMGLFEGFVVAPDNVGWWGPPKEPRVGVWLPCLASYVPWPRGVRNCSVRIGSRTANSNLLGVLR